MVIVPAPTVPGDRDRHHRERFPLCFRNVFHRRLLGRGEFVFFFRHHAQSVPQQDQAAGCLQHRHADAQQRQDRIAEPGAHHEDDEDGQRRLVRHPALNRAAEPPVIDAKSTAELTGLTMATSEVVKRMTA